MRDNMTLTRHEIIITTYVLSTLLIIRHSSYYLDGGIITEFGFNQPIRDILLIPITGSFGLLFYWGRLSKIKIQNWQIIRLLLIILTVIIMNRSIIGYDIFEIVTYSVTDYDKRRPIFLILIPICLSMIISRFKHLRGISFIIVLFSFAFLSNNFILYYATLILTAAMLSEKFLFLHKAKISVVIFASIFVCIIYFRIERLNFLLELLYVISFVSLLIRVATITGSHILQLPSFSILYFYIVQGTLYTLFVNWRYNLPDVAIIFSVFMLSLIISILATKLEYGVKKKYA